MSTASRPVLPVNALALPELTTSARALPPLSLARHHSTGADGHFERVSTPATRRALVEQREQHVGAALILDAGRAGREAHAGDLRHVGDVLRRERRNGGHGDRSRFVMSRSSTQNARRDGRALQATYIAPSGGSILLLLLGRRSRGRGGRRSRGRRRQALDLGFLAQLGDHLDLRAAHHIGLELVLDLVEFRRLAARACPRP